jgi:cytochrome c553
MNDWYVETQLQNFRSGARGTHFSDVEGMRMRPMALSLVSDEDVKAVAYYVGSMPPVRHAGSVPGDQQAGKQVYEICETCHGETGAGNQAVAAPRIAGVDGWYLATELRKFNSGVRGANPKDRQGRSMRAVSRGALPNEDAIRNVVAYIGTLKQ